MYVYFVAIVLDLVDNRTVVQSSLQRDALRYRRNVPKGNECIRDVPFVPESVPCHAKRENSIWGNKRSKVGNMA